MTNAEKKRNMFTVPGTFTEADDITG
jgi:hypothetical protein